MGSREAADIPNQKVYAFEKLSAIGHESLDVTRDPESGEGRKKGAP